MAVWHVLIHGRQETRTVARTTTARTPRKVRKRAGRVQLNGKWYSEGHARKLRALARQAA